MTFRSDYNDQMPKWKRFSLWRFVEIIGVLLGISGFLFTYLDLWSTGISDIKFIVSTLSLTLIILVLLGYILFREVSKKHRYAQAIFHIHFVNHTVRDFLASKVNGDPEPLSSVLSEIMDSIATAYSIVEGRQCRCCIKEIVETTHSASPQDAGVETTCRDSLSKKTTKETVGTKHLIRDNTDFSSIYLGRDGCSRYFHSANIPALWFKGEYNTSSITESEKPIRNQWFGVSNWPLEYKSALVLPIRYIPDNNSWPPRLERLDEMGMLDERKIPQMWGFLSVDSSSKNAFKASESKEMGAAFADALYTLFKQMSVLDQPTLIKPIGSKSDVG